MLNRTVRPVRHRCGRHVLADDRYCGGCGARLGDRRAAVREWAALAFIGLALPYVSFVLYQFSFR